MYTVRLGPIRKKTSRYYSTFCTIEIKCTINLFQAATNQLNTVHRDPHQPNDSSQETPGPICEQEDDANMDIVDVDFGDINLRGINDYDMFFNRRTVTGGQSDSSNEESDAFSSDDYNSLRESEDSSLDTSDSEDGEGENSVKVEKKIIALVAFMQKHRLKGNIIPDLISLLDLMIKIETDQMPLYPFKAEQVRQYLQKAKYPINKHYYCTACNAATDAEALYCVQCQADFTSIKSTSFFVSLSIAKQVERVLSNRTAYESVCTPGRQNVNDPPETLRDITDGRIYRHFRAAVLQEQQLQVDQMTVTFCFNTDGVRVFKSNHYDIWPIYLSILELPESVRLLSQNMIMASTWHGPKKPNLLLFLKPFFEEMRQLGREGIMIDTPGGPKLLKAYVLASTMDLPARALCLNMTSYNGEFSCHRCLHPGESHRTAAGGTVHCYSNEPHELRTRAGLLQDVTTAIQTRVVTRGMKGPSPLAHLPGYDICNGTVIDAMHGPMNGIFKQVVTLLFSVDHRDLTCNRHEKAGHFGKRLTSILPPHIIKRTPRTLQHLQHFKSSEWAMCLLFYMPAFYGLIAEENLTHLTLLSNAMFIFYQHAITPAQLAEAEQCLNRFCAKFEELLGKRFQTSNFHNLQHLVQDVRNFGPLWNTDCFAYENASGHLVKKIHGTRHVPSQLITAISMQHKMPYIIQENAMCETLGPFLQKVGMHAQRHENQILLDEAHGLYALPRISSVSEAKLQFLKIGIMELLGRHVMSLTNARRFQRFKIGSALYHTCKYERSQKQKSDTITYRDARTQQNLYGRAEEAYSVTVNTGMERPFGVQIVEITPLEIQDHCFGAAKHIKAVCPPSNDDQRILIYMTQVKGLCVFMQFPAITNKCFVSALPNISHIV